MTCVSVLCFLIRQTLMAFGKPKVMRVITVDIQKIERLEWRNEINTQERTKPYTKWHHESTTRHLVCQSDCSNRMTWEEKKLWNTHSSDVWFVTSERESDRDLENEARGSGLESVPSISILLCASCNKSLYMYGTLIASSWTDLATKNLAEVHVSTWCILPVFGEGCFYLWMCFIRLPTFLLRAFLQSKWSSRISKGSRWVVNRKCTNRHTVF